MQENLNKPINPHNNSVIPERLNLDFLKKEGKKEEYQEKETGDIYFKKHYHAGFRELHLREHFIALLTKGILHSADMVKIGDNDFFSRKINLENTEKGLPLEKEAEIFILKSILGDEDRNVDQPKHNIEQDSEGKFYHYDFESGFKGYEFSQIHKNYKNAYKIFYKFCEENKFSDKDIYNFSLQVFSKLKALEQAVNDKYFITALLNKTGFKPLYELEYVDYINNTNKTIKKIKTYFSKNITTKNIEDLNFIRVKKLLLKPIKVVMKVAEKEIKNSKIKASPTSS